eukprot:TRINITY_DN32576_c0_g1_i1.p1 TRINITY_DN32576_c0_g1~~TRINITY_DN32576_c0_g1_i1.p1  ORF type:complete len:325 (+),score=54.08 TRINITY_DN32576_c0_g1_i1:94-975(+)
MNDEEAGVGEFASAFYSVGPFEALTAMLVPPAPPPSDTGFTTKVLMCINAILAKMGATKQRPPVQLNKVYLAIGIVLKNRESPLVHVILAVRVVCAAVSWCNCLRTQDRIESDFALSAAFSSGLPEVLGTVLSALEVAPTRYPSDVSSILWFVGLVIHWVIEDWPNHGAQWRAQSLVGIFAARSADGKSVADFLLAKATVSDAVDLRRAVLLSIERGIIDDPSAVSVLRAFLDDLRWRRLKCGHEACGKPWDSTMKKCARCQAVSYCGTQCQSADWPRHKASCKKPAAPASVA